MTILVTGCAGFIGYYVTKACLERGWYVIGVDSMVLASRPESIIEFSKYPNFKFIQSDINDLDSLYECDYIINLAAATHVDNSIANSDVFVHSNINGVHHLLKLIKQGHKHHMPIFLHFSTDEVYGDIEQGAHTETDLLKPSNPYSATKAAADMLISAWARTHGVPYVIVRPTNNYGIGQYTEKFIPHTIKYLRLGKLAPLHDMGLPCRNWLNAKDTARAVLTIIDAGVVNEIYNIAGNYEEQNLIIALKIIEAMGFTGDPFQYLDRSVKRAGQDVRYAIDDSKLKNLGWAPQEVLDKELESIVYYYTNNFIW